ncbi:MAG: sodium:solute symporter family protein [Gemmatimonadota bacterium]
MRHIEVLIGLGAYLLVMIAIGLAASRRVRDSADFIVAGKRLGLVLCTGTLAATWFGGGLCIGAASAAYRGGFLAVIPDPFGAALCLFLAGLFYMRVLRRMGLMTVASFFTARFSRRAGAVASLCTVPAYVGWVASLMVAFGRILQSLTGLDPAVAICVGGAVVLVYTFAGGMWAVTLTDFLQLTILVVGMVLLTPVLIQDMGGWAAVAAQIPAERFHLYPRGGDAVTWFAYARDWLVIGLGNLAGQDLIQRSLSSRDEETAYRSAYLAGGLYLTVGMLPVVLGMAGAAVLPGLADPDLVMMELALKYLPQAALILFTGALVSALLSSADSALLAPASVIGWDLVRHVKPGASERLCLGTLRGAVIALGLVSLGLALYHATVYKLMVDSWSVLLATLFVPLTAGIWWPRANAPGALAAVGAGLVSWLLFRAVTPDLPGDLLAVPVAAAALVGASLLTARQTPPLPLATSDGQILAYEGRLGL